MDTLNEKKLTLCYKNLRLIKGFIHHCGVQKLGVYTSASEKIVRLIDETLTIIEPTHEVTTEKMLSGRPHK